jgi:WD40 repeat protein
MGFLRGHRGPVKVLQVESSVCVTGGADGKIKVWDLDVAESAPLASPTGVNGGQPTSLEQMMLGKEEDPFFVGSTGGAGLVNGEGDGLLREDPAKADQEKEEAGPCVKTLDGHTKAVTSLYFDGSCLVTGSSDSTLRQWDMTTGQCVLTMDILWAMQNPEPFTAPAPRPSYNTEKDYGLGGYSTPLSSPRKSMRRETSGFMGSASPATTTYADGSWEMYEDFVGGVQFWGYALASGTGDGCVRMWDSKHRMYAQSDTFGTEADVVDCVAKCVPVRLTARSSVTLARSRASSSTSSTSSVAAWTNRSEYVVHFFQHYHEAPLTPDSPLDRVDLGLADGGDLGHDPVRAPDHRAAVRLAQDRRCGRREWRARE